jgi:hypothetical protein
MAIKLYFLIALFFHLWFILRQRKPLDYKVSNGRMDDELGSIWKELVVAQSSYFPTICLV